ncbi:alpha-beta hydrolase superfamily lysophospholipase [Geodermatophilus tzadiensis]|uniref:Alpha-beta hydrolase superfamily lysophospholipase n=1 Tax=Geodermatophilus tzadiensis TaxID=1137988 RepID=A0A2T0U1G4_9ACTN|nr:alpha/beta fold hydrolase [Geodermatophilus tzadiensis]PRY51761.1 alpha-beta hydrolase superfamily lysophospholipase [Geodermatophilus tzadiensis]
MTVPATRQRVPGADGVEVAVHRWGAPGDRPPVYLQHGFVADTRLNWVGTGVLGALLSAGREVVGVDARGHGRSDRPHDPGAYGELRMADDLRRVADALGHDAFDLAGFSMGATVALLTAAADRRVRRLVVCGVGAPLVEPGGAERHRVLMAGLAAAFEAADVADVRDPVTAPYRRLADALAADRHALAAHARAVHTRDVDLAAVTAPTLVLVGDVDPLGARPEVLAAALPDARVTVVPGDHSTALRAPAFAAALVGHLEEDR